MLVLLVVALLAMLVWLAGVYETAQVQGRLERDAAQVVADIQSAFTRNAQTLQSLQYSDPTPDSWAIEAASVLLEHRELAGKHRDTGRGCFNASSDLKAEQEARRPLRPPGHGAPNAGEELGPA